MPPASTKGAEARTFLETGEIPQAPKIKFVPPNKSAREPSRRSSKTPALTPQSTMIKACVKAMDDNGVVSWFDAMREAGYRPGRSKSTLCTAIDACTQAKDSGQIIAWYNTMREAGATPSEATFNLAIKAYANSGDVSGAERWIDAMWQAGFTPNAFSFNAVINRCARAGDVLSAERWLSLMQDAGATPNQLTFNSVIQAYTLAADPAGAVRWFQAMQTAKVPANEKTFSSIVNAHAQAKDVSGAERWFEAMQQDGFKPDVISFNTVINACAQVRDVARGERWLKAMQEAGLQPNQVTYNVMIKAHALSGDAAGAERWFEQMKQAGFSHNLRSFSSMATAYGQAFTVDLSKVDEMVAEMRKLQLYPDHEVLTSLLKCCAHAQPPQPAVALAWFREFIPRAHLMAHVERALRQAVGNIQADGAILWAKQMHPQLFQLQPLHGGRGANTGNRIEHSGGSTKERKGEKYNGAEVVVEIHAPEKCHRYLIGIRGAAIKQIQNKAGAYVFFPNTKNTPPRARPSNKDAITIVGEKSACERAQELIFARLSNCRAYVSNGFQDSGSSGSSGRGQQGGGGARSGNRSGGGADGGARPGGMPFHPQQYMHPGVLPLQMTFQNVPNVLTGGTMPGSLHGAGGAAVDGGDANARVLTPELLQTCANALRAAGMAWSRSAMVAEGLENAEPSRMIDMCSCAVNADGVVKWFEAMSAAGCRPTEVTFTSAIKAYGYKKNVKAAEFWFEAMQLCGFSPNEKAYSSIINAHARAKDINGAEAWFRKMREAGLQPDHVSYNIMINAYTTVKDLGGAERWFDDMRSAGFGRSQPLYASMAVAYATARRVPFTKVKALVEDMRVHGLSPDCDTLSSLLKSCSRSSPPQAAVAAQWFQEFIGATFLSPAIEKTTLPMAVGLEVAQQLCVWAQETHPTCTVSSVGRRPDGPGGTGFADLSDCEKQPIDGENAAEGHMMSHGGVSGPAAAAAYGYGPGNPWGAPQTEMAWQERPPLYSRLPTPGPDGHPQYQHVQGQMPMLQMQMQGAHGGPQYAMSHAMQQQQMQFHKDHPGMPHGMLHQGVMPLGVDGAGGGHYGFQHMGGQQPPMGMPGQMHPPQMQFQKAHGHPMMQGGGVQYSMPNGMAVAPQGPNGELQDSSGHQVSSNQPGMLTPMAHAQMAGGMPHHTMAPHPGGMGMNEMTMPVPNGAYSGPMQPMPMQHYSQPVDAAGLPMLSVEAAGPSMQPVEAAGPPMQQPDVSA